MRQSQGWQISQELVYRQIAQRMQELHNAAYKNEPTAQLAGEIKGLQWLANELDYVLKKIK